MKYLLIFKILITHPANSTGTKISETIITDTVYCKTYATAKSIQSLNSSMGHVANKDGVIQAGYMIYDTKIITLR